MFGQKSVTFGPPLKGVLGGSPGVKRSKSSGLQHVKTRFFDLKKGNRPKKSAPGSYMGFYLRGVPPLRRKPPFLDPLFGGHFSGLFENPFCTPPGDPPRTPPSGGYPPLPPGGVILDPPRTPPGRGGCFWTPRPAGGVWRGTPAGHPPGPGDRQPPHHARQSGVRRVGPAWPCASESARKTMAQIDDRPQPASGTRGSPRDIRLPMVEG
jgi:hypothetical protein